MNIKESVARIVQMRSRLNQELLTLREACPHLDKTGKHGANTGNWCSTDDDYWISAECCDCGRTWTIYHSENPEGYRRFDGRIVK